MAAVSPANLNVTGEIMSHFGEQGDHFLERFPNHFAIRSQELQSAASRQRIVTGQWDMKPLSQTILHNGLSRSNPSSHIMLCDSSLDVINFRRGNPKDGLDQVSRQQFDFSLGNHLNITEYLNRGNLHLSNTSISVIVPEVRNQLLGLITRVSRQSGVERCSDFMHLHMFSPLACKT